MSNRMPSRSRFFLSVLPALLVACEATPPPESATVAGRSAPSLEVRQQVDPGRGRVWWLTRYGVFVHELGRTERVEVNLPEWQVAGESYGCMPDLTLGPRGDAFVTSNVSPVIWKIDARTLDVTTHRLELDADQDKDVGFTGLLYVAAHGAFYAASDAHGTLWRIEPTLTAARRLSLSAPVRDACGLELGLPVGPKSKKLASLCVRGSSGDWMIHLAKDERSGNVRAIPARETPCAPDLPS